ncbi:MAG: transposase [Candidatus Scalindua sp. AMX11]|nr:MAG: transposase [Candidatus Scalindua sp.]TDE66975.1 MAG: transposase [Candidatus Scalindua sp. AMX11]
MEDISNVNKIYHPRNPQDSPLWKMLDDHYDSFEQGYDERFEKPFGFFRSIISEVVHDYLSCGDLKNGFARIRCNDCSEEYLLAFSCKSRWFCPSCHAKKVIQFGESLRDNILYPIPHRQYVFTIPIMLRLFFKYDRKLLSKLCWCAYDSLLVFFRNAVGLENGRPGAIMTIHTFGNYAEKFHPHIHAIVSDGLFRETGTFYVMPDVDLKPLEDIFRASVFKMLRDEGKIDDDIINKLMSWRHSGFSVHNGSRIARDDEEGKEAISQYIIRNTFSLEKLTYNEKTNTVIYQSKMTPGKNKRNFQIYTPEEFIAAITQHIPEKSFQMVRYYGWYSNKSRGVRKKQGILKPGESPEQGPVNIEIIDVSDYKPPRIPSKKWRECIKKIYEVDPLCCPKCGGEMKIISFINEFLIVKQILEHLGLWVQKPSRDPPDRYFSPENNELTYEPFYDDCNGYEDPCIMAN